MSGDIQTRQRRKEKKKPKRDEPSPLGVDISKFTESEKKNVQMHVEDDHDHGVGWCAKIVFFILMAILVGLVGLILFENQGASDLDTPLSESRFSEYLQGWVDENREDDHHDDHAAHFASHDDDEGHDDDDDGHATESHHGHDDHDDDEVPDDEPYPEEKDNSNPDEIAESEELIAEINQNDSQDAPTEVDEEDEGYDGDEETEEADNKNDNDDDDDDVPNLFEDSTPFEEEQKKLTKPVITSKVLTKQVDELAETLSEISKMLGKDGKTKNLTKTKKDEKKIDSEQDDIENVVDNDDGEDLMLQKIAEEIEAAAQHQASQEIDDDADDDNENAGESSLGVKLGVGVLLAIVAHQIIYKKISATNRSDSSVPSDTINEQILNTRRLTVLSTADERLINECSDDNEEIIEVMMVTSAGQLPDEYEDYEDEEEPYTDSEGEYSEEEGVEFEAEEIITPKTFEDFNKLFKIPPELIEEEPQSVDVETEAAVEKELLKVPEKMVKEESFGSSEISDEGQVHSHDEIDNEEEEEFDEEEMLEEEEMEDEENPDDIEELSEEEQEEIDYDESEEDLSDINDDELLKRLEAKYGKLDDKKNDDDEDDTWTKIPNEGGAQSYLEEILNDENENEDFENIPEIKKLYEKAKKLDALADEMKSNQRLIEAIEVYKDLIVNHKEKLNDKIFKEISERCIERLRFLGKLKAAIEIHKEIISRFGDDPNYQNQLAVTYLLGNNLAAAKRILHNILTRWRYNGFALVHYGFVIKNLDLDNENAAIYLQEGIDTNEPGTQDGRFYFHLGDALQRLGRHQEAQKVYQDGAKNGIFLSEYQRSLYNVDHLKSRPFWTKIQTTYKDDLTEIQKYWHVIRDEGLKLLSKNDAFTNEAENLKDTGDWKQFELFARGRKTKNCHLAPITCNLLEKFLPASTCKRGQVKFSVLHPNTHVFSHCGPTNCRIRCHLGLRVPEKTAIRVANETKSWHDGQWLIFDDSFEHEVWHNGTSARLVLIVDVWHPDLTEQEKQNLSPI